MAKLATTKEIFLFFTLPTHIQDLRHENIRRIYRRETTRFSHATGELTALLSAIKLGAKIIHRDINKAGLVDILGTNGVSNVQGEAQMKLDLYANEKLKLH